MGGTIMVGFLRSQMYGRIYRVVEPKRARMNAALAQLAEKQAAQAEAQARLREVSVLLQEKRECGMTTWDDPHSLGRL